ncbi:hypothetical protein QBC43DRAFT_6795 [Cladorrhinum sp. PSN259]|nr:hypothetical protein QBC43DRAFT_6795 [Cladorrhinum sp. PSN259]
MFASKNTIIRGCGGRLGPIRGRLLGGGGFPAPPRCRAFIPLALQRCKIHYKQSAHRRGNGSHGEHGLSCSLRIPRILRNISATQASGHSGSHLSFFRLRLQYCVRRSRRRRTGGVSFKTVTATGPGRVPQQKESASGVQLRTYISDVAVEFIKAEDNRDSEVEKGARRVRVSVWGVVRVVDFVRLRLPPSSTYTNAGIGRHTGRSIVTFPPIPTIGGPNGPDSLTSWVWVATRMRSPSSQS